MILLHGIPDDPPLAAVVEALSDDGVPYALLSPAALGRDGLSADGRRLRVAGQDWPVDAIEAIYSRPLPPPAAPAGGGAAAGDGLRQHQRLVDWLDRHPATVVNRPSAMQSNGSKPLQIQLIAAAGFTVPETLVTSDPDEALAFRARHGRVIFKSISGVRSIVRELTDEHRPRLARLRDLPVQFQARVPGVDVRVHVVGQRCHATRIESDQTDYRYPGSGGGTRMAPMVLDEACAARCVALAAGMGLLLAGIDLRLTPDGEFICFECNPMPAYSHFEQHTGQPISVDLARLLRGASH